MTALVALTCDKTARSQTAPTVRAIAKRTFFISLLQQYPVLRPVRGVPEAGPSIHGAASRRPAESFHLGLLDRVRRLQRAVRRGVHLQRLRLQVFCPRQRRAP